MQSFIRPVTHLSARLIFYHQQSRPGKQRIKVWLHEMISEYGDLPFTLSRRGQSGSCSMSHIYWAETQNKGRWWNSVCRTAVVDFKMWEKHRLFSALQLELICVAETDLSVPTEADLFHLNRQHRTQSAAACTARTQIFNFTIAYSAKHTLDADIIQQMAFVVSLENYNVQQEQSARRVNVINNYC